MSQALAVSLAELPDSELLTQARHGIGEALVILFQRHHGPLLRYARSVVRSRSDAEDLTAEALLRMMLALKAGKGPTTNTPAYLRTTVRRLAAEHGGDNARLVSVGLAFAEAERDEAGRPGARDQPTDHEALLDLAFRSLAPRWRQVLWMSEVLGYRPHEIATALAIAPAAASALLWRARRALRFRFEELRPAAPVSG
ncbi:sigma-70 family RNA polymerase sigma factor [Amycolatopsis rhizosphaerae]|uniref:Sigma-70 family RNA polymerase sigma factor n=1 Tax=Amycolatopsis rhizosphaerae TaxID=2053003 RepID=A0A558AFM6_9PSEU|nr:sigma-70 family RNA polymerase sigma factor [Amycolatopsis rhizosphaerae]TVT23064.1 sigma-70 family RNA polymerase sigma factor [Amycolatopsis rhizosphaerae]